MNKVILLALVALVFCLDPMPGLDKLGVGFDVVHGELRNHVLDFSYAAGKTWQNPNYPTLVYAVPDQVDVFNFPSASVTSEQYSAVSTQQYSRTLTENAGVSFSYGMFSLSASVSRAKSYMQSSSSTSKYVSTTQRLNLWKMNTVPPFLPIISASTWFKQGIDALPEDMSTPEAQQLYLQFIQYFGTHYIIEGTYGGSAKMSTAVDIFVYSVDQEETVTVDVQTEFYAKISGHYNDSIQYKSKLYKSYHMSDLSFEGGNPEITNWENWIPTVKQNPILINYKVGLITDLIKTSPAKHDNMNKMIGLYVSGAFSPASCQELKNSGKASTDGEYKVNYQGDPTRTFTVYCANMNTPVPSDYITVTTGKGMNYGAYCDTAERTSCATHYSKLRIDPYSLYVDVNDQTFASTQCNSGGPKASPFNDIVACQCNGDLTSTPIDLTGTALTIDPSVTCSVAQGSLVNVQCNIVGTQKLQLVGDAGGMDHCGEILPNSPSSALAGPKFAIKLNVVSSQ